MRHVIRRCHTDARELFATYAYLRQQLSCPILEEFLDVGWQSEGNLARRAGAHLTREIQHHHGDVVAIHVQSNREHTVWIDHQFSGRLTATTTSLTRLTNPPIVEKSLGDVGNCRCRKTGDFCEFNAGDRACYANRMERDALVVIARPLEIRAREM